MQDNKGTPTKRTTGSNSTTSSTNDTTENYYNSMKDAYKSLIPTSNSSKNKKGN